MLAVKGPTIQEQLFPRAPFALRENIIQSEAYQHAHHAQQEHILLVLEPLHAPSAMLECTAEQGPQRAHLPHLEATRQVSDLRHTQRATKEAICQRRDPWVHVCFVTQEPMP